MLLTGSGSDRSLSSVVFVADGHPFCRAEGDFVPVSEDDPASCSLATGVAIVRPRVFDQPPLSQNDYLVGVPVNTVPVGRPFEFVRGSLGENNSRPLYSFRSPPGFSYFSSKQFPGGVTGSHRTPQGSKGSCSHLRGDPRVDPKKRYRPNRRFSVALPFSYFCDSEENRGSSGNFELEENQCVHSGSTFPDGNTECNSTGIAPSGLGRFVRLEGRLPSRADSPSVQETAGFQFQGRLTCTRSCRSA